MGYPAISASIQRHLFTAAIRQLAYMPRVARIDWQAIRADAVAVAVRLFPLQCVIVVALAYSLKAAIIAPEQFFVAVVRCQVVDHCGAWVRPTAGKTTSALLAGVAVPEKDALPCRPPSSGLVERAGHCLSRPEPQRH